MNVENVVAIIEVVTTAEVVEADADEDGCAWPFAWKTLSELMVQ